MHPIAINEFKEVIDKIKALKCDYILIDNLSLCGVDENMFIYKRSTINNYGIKIACATESIVEFYKYTTEVGSAEVYVGQHMLKSDYGEFYGNNIELGSIINNNFQGMLNLFNCSIKSCHIEDMRTIDEFNKIISQKAADGIGLIIIENKYPITLSSNMLPLNKSDKIGLFIYDIGDGTFIPYFLIKKPKQTIEIFMRCIRL